MKIYNITESNFRKYGKIQKEIDFTELVDAMQKLPIPEDVVYVPSDRNLEALPVAVEIKNKLYGELPVQIGYCIGHSVLLNAVEYHRTSEFIVAATDLVLLLGSQQDITEDFTYDSSLMEAFLVPEGCCVELYATTLHYAPSNANENGFLATIILPKGTNTDLEAKHNGGEDRLLAANNKWLIAHPDSKIEGAHYGIIGDNLSVK